MVSTILRCCTNSGPAVEAGWGCRLHRAWRRGVVFCLVMVVASFCLFLISSPHHAKLSYFIPSLPEYNDFLMPSNTSVPLSPSSLLSPGSPGASHDPDGVSKGFLVHSPSCSIPELDPMHHTIKRYIFKPKPIKCGKHPAFTSSRGSTLYLHRDVLRLHFPAINKVYEFESRTTTTTKKPSTKHKTTKTTTKTTKKTPTKTTKKTPTTTTTTTTTTTPTPTPTPTTSHTPPPTTPSKISSKPSPSSPSSPPPKKRARRSAQVKSSSEDVKCCYKGMYRTEQTREKAGGSADGRWRYNDTCKALNDTTTEVKEDAVLVECRIGTVIVYKNVHYFFHREKFLSSSRVILSIHSNVQHVSPSSGTLRPSDITSTQRNTQSNKTIGSKVNPKVGQSTDNPSTYKLTSHDAASTQTPNTPKHKVKLHRVKDSEKLNVIIMGTDSVSRLNMLRHLSKTYEYLMKELGAVDLKGYNKVGDNTIPNLMPILGGITREELDNHTCVMKSRHYDDCHWLWKDFKKSNYVTAYMEDSPWMGTFHYLRRGFIAKPTDYYGRPFMLASEKEIGTPKGQNGHNCQGDKLSIEVVQNYALDYARTFHDVPFFGYFWSASLTHDHINFVELADESYLQYLQEMEKMGALNNTALVFMSDHGMRWGGIRSTYIGMMEERMPYVIVYLPPWFRKKYQQAYGNLKRNTHRLTSNFDVHETILDLAYGRFADNAYVTSKPSSTMRGTSLFRNVAWNRTCAEANIPENFCCCQNMIELTEEDEYLVPAANYFLDDFNKLLQPYPQCVQFTKIEVLSARLTIPSKVVKPKEEKSELRTYLLQASLLPGNVVVEGSIQHIKHDNSFKIIGDTSRINKYGNTSSCIKHDVLRKYCYCEDQKKAEQIFSNLAKSQGGSEDRKNK